MLGDRNVACEAYSSHAGLSGMHMAETAKNDISIANAPGLKTIGFRRFHATPT